VACALAVVGTVYAVCNCYTPAITATGREGWALYHLEDLQLWSLTSRDCVIWSQVVVRYTPKAMGSHTGVVPVHVLPMGGTAVVQVGFQCLLCHY
jgi:hypothetical protein